MRSETSASFEEAWSRKLADFRPELDGSQDYDLVLRCARRDAAATRIRHVPRVLYHLRARAGGGGLDARSDALETGRRAVEEHLVASGIRATIGRADRQSYQVEYALPSPLPRVSILLPSTCEPRLIEPCLRSLLTLTTYRNFEILLLDQ